jgi:hypothetical protein
MSGYQVLKKWNVWQIYYAYDFIAPQAEILYKS